MLFGIQLLELHYQRFCLGRPLQQRPHDLLSAIAIGALVVGRRRGRLWPVRLVAIGQGSELLKHLLHVRQPFRLADVAISLQLDNPALGQALQNPTQFLSAGE